MSCSNEIPPGAFHCDLTLQQEKKLAIVREILNTATAIQVSFRDIPATHKRRNIFIKNYNRRPQGKIKKARALAMAGIAGFIGALQIEKIIQQPIPNYEKGTM